jgi:imidazolonepropionase-like amidohydrolase
MRAPASVFLVIAFLASSVALAQRTSKPKVTAFEVGRLIVGNGQPWIEDAVFVVEDGRFKQVGRRGTVKVPPGAARVRLSGKNVMPAIIDTQTRVLGSREEVVQQLRRRAQYGAVVVASGVSDATTPVFQLRDEILPNAARLFAMGELASPQLPATIPTSEADARRMVHELADTKIGLIRIWVDNGEGTQPKLTPEVYRAIIDEAHARGMRVLAHVRTLQDTKDLLRAGVDALGGVPRDKVWDREAITLFRERRANVIVVANMWDSGVPADVSWLRPTVPTHELPELGSVNIDRPDAKSAADVQVPNLGYLTFERIRIAMGSDTTVAWGHLREMEAMDVALLPFEVILAAGHNAALLLGLKDHGGIVPGNVANFLVVNGNPAMDLTAIRNVEAVYLRGVAIEDPAFPPPQKGKQPR